MNKIIIENDGTMYHYINNREFYKYDTLSFETLNYIKKLEEIKKKLEFINNRKNQGATEENINKMAIDFIKYYLKMKKGE